MGVYSPSSTQSIAPRGRALEKVQGCVRSKRVVGFSEQAFIMSELRSWIADFTPPAPPATEAGAATEVGAGRAALTGGTSVLQNLRRIVRCCCKSNTIRKTIYAEIRSRNRPTRHSSEMSHRYLSTDAVGGGKRNGD